jgi:hypothetical protein
MRISIRNRQVPHQRAIENKQLEQAAHFFDSFFLKVSIDQFSQSFFL